MRKGENWDKNQTFENTDITVVYLDSGCMQVSDIYFIFSGLNQNKPILKTSELYLHAKIE